MGELFESFYTTNISWQTALFSFLISFLLASVIAKVYEITYEGLSWSKSLTQSLILGSQVTCLIMMAIGDNIARGIGIIGSLAIIRFRTNLRDPRDMVFIFAALGVGVAAGVQSYIVATVGAVAFCLVALSLKLNNIGAKRQSDGLIRLQLPAKSDAVNRVAEVLGRETKHFALVNMHEVAQGKIIDLTYQVKLPHPDKAEELLQALGEISEVGGLRYISQQSNVEV